MFNFKDSITVGLSKFLSEISNDLELPEDELHNKYLINKKVERNPSGYMLFVKKMHKENPHKNHPSDNKVIQMTFINKSKLIGNKWKNLTKEEKMIYNKKASELIKIENICISKKNNVTCPKIVYENNEFCKKHYKENIKKEKNKIKEKIVKFTDVVEQNADNYTVDIVIIDNNTYYKDIYGNMYKKLENSI